jgi:sugar/nucleoside kinase (ribokinase family)
MGVLCLGEALVDLICERPVDSLVEADAFVPHPGGALANVAVIAARHGAQVSLAGGAGEDAFGVWLRDRLADEGVGLEWFTLVADAPTPIAFVSVDARGEPEFLIHGAGIHAAVASAAERLPEAVEASSALVFASNTLVDDDERRATLAARERALELGRPVLFDPNLRLGRWPHPGRAASVVRECIPDAFVVKCNRAEAELISGEADPERAAAGLLAAGAQHVVITLGRDGALLRGAGLKAATPGVPAKVVNATGAGDAFFGVLVARLAASGWYPPALAAALPEAAREAAAATERWGAT